MGWLSTLSPAGKFASSPAGDDRSSRFSTIAHDALEFGVDSAILDGEAVVLD